MLPVTLPDIGRWLAIPFVLGSLAAINTWDLPTYLGLVVAATGCTNEGSGLGPSPEVKRRVEVGVYLDRDGSRTVTPLDTVFAKARVALFIKGSTDTFKVAVTPNSGIAIFNDIPLGQYTIAIEPRSIGDSIQVLLHSKDAEERHGAIVQMLRWHRAGLAALDVAAAGDGESACQAQCALAQLHDLLEVSAPMTPK